MENTEEINLPQLKTYIEGQFSAVNIRLDTFNKHLARLNGQTARNAESAQGLDHRLAVVETRCVERGQVSERAHARIERDQGENRKGIKDLVKENGNTVMQILIILGLIGGWLGWW